MKLCLVDIEIRAVFGRGVQFILEPAGCCDVHISSLHRQQAKRAKWDEHWQLELSSAKWCFERRNVGYFLKKLLRKRSGALEVEDIGIDGNIIV